MAVIRTGGPQDQFYRRIRTVRRRQLRPPFQLCIRLPSLTRPTEGGGAPKLPQPRPPTCSYNKSDPRGRTARVACVRTSLRQLPRYRVSRAYRCGPVLMGGRGLKWKRARALTAAFDDCPAVPPEPDWGDWWATRLHSTLLRWWSLALWLAGSGGVVLMQACMTNVPSVGVFVVKNVKIASLPNLLGFDIILLETLTSLSVKSSPAAWRSMTIDRG